MKPMKFSPNKNKICRIVDICIYAGKNTGINRIIRDFLRFTRHLERDSYPFIWCISLGEKIKFNYEKNLRNTKNFKIFFFFRNLCLFQC